MRVKKAYGKVYGAEIIDKMDLAEIINKLELAPSVDAETVVRCRIAGEVILCMHF